MSEYHDEAKRSLLGDDRLVESLLDTPRFEELLKVAEQLCLSEAPDYTKYERPQHSEADVISSLGVLGLRYAIELAEGAHNVSRPSSELPAMHPLRQPDLYTGPLNREMLAKATAFGAKLIDESYDVIGSDADGWLEEFIHAENDEEQIAVLEELHDRLRELGNDRRGLDEDSSAAGVYHPIRLSPKLIGSYPDHVLPPTCLGIAAIGAGFLKKAGATFLHAGIMENSLQTEVLDLCGLIEGMGGMCESLGVSVPEEISSRLDHKLGELVGILFEDTGTHSALLVRLRSGGWYQFDPNLNQSERLRRRLDDEGGDTIGHNATVEKAYGDLTHFRDIAPGLELGAAFPRMMFGFAWVRHIRNLDAMDVSGVESVLAADNASMTANIRRYVIEEWLPRTSDGMLYEYIEAMFLNNFQLVSSDGKRDELINAVTTEAIESFVFHEMPEEEWAQSYKAGEGFRRQALEDIRRLPALIGILYATHLVSDGPINQVHSRMELGLPETSIGLAVLHNIGLHVADDLSVYHWLTQWPSHIVPPDMLHKMSHSPMQAQTVRNHLQLLGQHRSFGYFHTYGKIYSSEMDNSRNRAAAGEPDEVEHEQEES